MKLLKTTLIASALILGTGSMALAQTSYGSGTKAKDAVVDKATDIAKDKAKDVVGDKAGAFVDPAVKAGENMIKGDSVKDAVIKAGTSEAKSYGSGGVAGEAAKSMDAKDTVTAGKVLIKGGSKEEAALAVAKDNAKDAMMDKADGLLKDKATSYGSGTKDAMKDKAEPYGSGTGTIKSSAPAYGSGTTAPASAPAATTINCPSGTTAQADGTCMVTGNYQPRS